MGEIVGLSDAIDKRATEMVAKRKPENKDGGDSDEPPITFVEECLQANEVGDSLLYSYMNRGKFAYNTVAGVWLRFIGPHWDIDWDGQAKAAVESTVVEQYLRLIDHYDKKMTPLPDPGDRKLIVKKKTSIFGRIKKLRSVNGRNNCLACARSNSDPLTVQPDQFDLDPLLLPVRNGVVNMRTGQLRDGRPDDWITRVAPTDWTGIDTDCPHFEKFLMTSLDHPDKFEFLHKTLGYSATALSSEPLFVVFWGPHGRNGKDTLMETLFNTLGDLVGPIQSEMLLAGGFQRNSSGPSPDIMDLKGKRIVWGSEVDQNTRWAIGEIKRYSGNGSLTGRNPNDKRMTTFTPTHTLFQLTNYRPHAPADDDAFFERIVIILWPLSFIKRELSQPWHRKADPDLDKKLRQEASGILAWLVRGYHKYLYKGLTPPDCIIADTNDYRRNEDIIADFIEECCEISPEYEEKFSTIYTKYKVWYDDVSGGRKAITKKKLGQLLKDKFVDQRKHSGIFYLGLRIKAPGLGDDNG